MAGAGFPCTLQQVQPRESPPRTGRDRKDWGEYGDSGGGTGGKGEGRWGRSFPLPAPGQRGRYLHSPLCVGMSLYSKFQEREPLLTGSWGGGRLELTPGLVLGDSRRDFPPSRTPLLNPASQPTLTDTPPPRKRSEPVGPPPCKLSPHPTPQLLSTHRPETAAAAGAPAPAPAPAPSAETSAQPAGQGRVSGRARARRRRADPLPADLGPAPPPGGEGAPTRRRREGGSLRRRRHARPPPPQASLGRGLRGGNPFLGPEQDPSPLGRDCELQERSERWEGLPCPLCPHPPPRRSFDKRGN